ncbi:hypothetical protein MG290_09610 [Flavobacterium sp. CBA20B-1]|uniref:hypothetical protein n=1 Tax=unclassified Flavobacterium TaxID=196869 RepID=UPI002224858B|nr:MULTISPECIES: hypothetical protein [unclassified Flavobacterium]WCM41213.1 hypothetical protein MG290_09610 [Flavobacterium sp. CBA20B-1]
MLILVSIVFVSCEKDDLVEEVNRGTIEVEIEGEKFKFGEKSYADAILRITSSTPDTIGYFYETRISKDYQNYDQLEVYGYLRENGAIDSLRIIYTALRNGIGTTYNYNYPGNPLVISNVNYNQQTGWLTANFEGYLYRANTLDDIKVFLKDGKISVPLKGLDIPQNYTHARASQPTISELKRE